MGNLIWFFLAGLWLAIAYVLAAIVCFLREIIAAEGADRFASLSGQ